MKKELFVVTTPVDHGRIIADVMQGVSFDSIEHVYEIMKNCDSSLRPLFDVRIYEMAEFFDDVNRMIINMDDVYAFYCYITQKQPTLCEKKDTTGTPSDH